MSPDDSAIEIGHVEYSTSTYMLGPDKRRALEAGGKNGSGYRNLLLIEQFGDTRVKDLPTDLDISIFHPNTPLALIESIGLRHLHHHGQIDFSIFYSHSTWSNPKNLRHYAKELAGKLISELDEVSEAKVAEDEGCVWINAQARISTSTVILEYVVDLERRIKELSDRASAIHGTSSGTVDPSQPHLKPDEKGLKWWLRYIAVPILGGAGLIGVVKLLLGQA